MYSSSALNSFSCVSPLEAPLQLIADHHRYEYTFLTMGLLAGKIHFPELNLYTLAVFFLFSPAPSWMELGTANLLTPWPLAWQMASCRGHEQDKSPQAGFPELSQPGRHGLFSHPFPIADPIRFLTPSFGCSPNLPQDTLVSDASFTSTPIATEKLVLLLGETTTKKIPSKTILSCMIHRSKFYFYIQRYLPYNTTLRGDSHLPHLYLCNHPGNLYCSVSSSNKYFSVLHPILFSWENSRQWV